MKKEQRKYLRFGCTFPAEIVQLEPEKNLVGKAKIDDFSREGIKLILTFNLEPGSNIDLTLRLPESQETASVSGQVMWSRSKNGDTQLGLKITDMDSTAKSEIFDSLYTQWIENRSRDIEATIIKKKSE